MRILPSVILYCGIIISSAALYGQNYQVSLEPGEGTILLLGTGQELSQVQLDYFGNSPRRKAQGPLDELLLGPLSGADMREDAEWAGVAHNEYLDDVMGMYADMGSTVALAYRSDMGTDDAQNFAAIAARHGLKAILEPVDAYWRQPHQQSEFWLDKMAEYGGVVGYTADYLIPLMERNAPRLRNDRNILGWQLTEEIYWGSEPYFTPYKQAFKRLFPNQLLFQIDSQQLDSRLMQHKQPPYPDILGADFYPFFGEVAEPETQDFYPAPWPAVGLPTPHQATKSLYLNMRHYAQAAYDLFDRPAVLVLAGSSMGNLLSRETGEKAGYEAREGFLHCRGAVRWLAESDSFLYWRYYLAPENAYRLQHWIGVACGFKGIMYWSIGPAGSPAELEIMMRDTPDVAYAPTRMRLALCYRDLGTHRHFREVSNSWRQLRRYEDLILDTHPTTVAEDEKPYKIMTDPYVYSGLLKDSVGRSYLVVVNGQIGKWDQESPEVLGPESTLEINRYGELENHTPLREPRTIELQLTGTARPFDLRTMQPLAQTAARTDKTDKAN